MVNFDLNCTF